MGRPSGGGPPIPERQAMDLLLTTVSLTLAVLLAAGLWHIGRGVRDGFKEHKRNNRNRQL